MIGHVVDADGDTVAIGVDGAAVIIRGGGLVRLERSDAEEFAQLFTRACWQASPQGDGP